MKNAYKSKVIIMIVSIVLCLSYIRYERVYALEFSEKTILNDIEQNYNNNNDFNDEYIEKAEVYAETLRKDSEYYFIRGYFDYIASDYKSAIQNFELAKNDISNSNSIFVKVYNYILLNQCLIEEKQFDDLVENCKSSFEYIARDINYKNNKDVIWKSISTLISNDETSKYSAEILDSYITQTKGLKAECKIQLKGNLAFLYSLDYRYSESIYQCLDMLELIEKNPNLPSRDLYKVKAYTFIGNIYFSMYSYDEAIYMYNLAINSNIEDENKEFMAKWDAYINIAYSYIETEEYDVARNVSEEMLKKLKYIDDYAKDDIDMLINNNLALINIYQQNFDLAREQLKYCQQLLDNDEKEFSVDKDIFLSLSYAKLFKEEERYDEAINSYIDTLDKSIERGVGLDFEIYTDIVDIYKKTGDLNNYIKYSELLLGESYKFIAEADKKYINSSFKSYENDKMKLEKKNQQITVVILSFSSIFFLLFIVLKSRKIKELSRSNNIDAMSKLYNRKFLDYYIKKNYNNLKDKEFTIILIDIDCFKKYNDNYGHVKGDQVIRQISESILDNIGKNDVAIRYGGEEFLIIIDTNSIATVEHIAYTIENSIKDKNIEHKYSEAKDYITVSMGIYIKKSGANEDIYNSIDKADKALYEAKNSGRNKYKCFEGI